MRAGDVNEFANPYMEAPNALTILADDLEAELTQNILPYWRAHAVDQERGGFHGQITRRNEVVANAPKGAVLNARILWAVSAASRALDDDTYRPLADRAYEYLTTHFWDETHGGIYWMLRPDGTPLKTKKQVYAQAFAIYALAEYHRLTDEPEPLARAIQLFELLEEHAFDGAEGGYFEAYSRDWHLLDDVRLSAKAPKSMNTHLHVLEAYTTLHRAWPEPALKTQLRDLIRLFLDTILDAETHHVISFFDECWTPRSELISFGHDIEASWLLVEAAEVIGEAALLEETQAAAVRIARTTQDEGQDADGGLLYEIHADGTLDDDKHGWPQAEAIVGFVNAYQISGEQAFLDAALRCWDFTQQHMLDAAHGEWLYRVARTGAPYPDDDKVGPWKGPYHNTRACLEIMRRAEEIAASPPEWSDASANTM